MALTVLAAAGKLIGAGACLGIGFWMSKKLTNVADEYLAYYDERRIARLTTGV